MAFPVTIVDYEAGNLRSVAKALEHVGARPIVTGEASDVLRAEALVVPGQGAGDSAMRALAQRGLVGPLREAVSKGTPFLGVCLGMQILLDVTEEGGETRCLGAVAGRVRRFPPGLKVPHMGWNTVALQRAHPVFEGIPPASFFYFVHSYYCDPTDASVLLGMTDYGVSFCSAIARDNLVATQFHPEKSGPIGLRVYRNFVRWASQVTTRTAV